MNVDVAKIELILPKEKIVSLLDNFQAGGYMEIIEQDSISKEHSASYEDYKLRMSEITFALSFLERFKPKENFVKNLIFSFVPQKEQVSQEEIERITKSSETVRVVRDCADIEERINTLKSRKEKLLAEVAVVSNFTKTSVFKSGPMSSVDYLAGSIQLAKKESFLSEITKSKNGYVEEGGDSTAIFYFVIYYPKQQKKQFEDIIKRYEVREESVFWEEEAETAFRERSRELETIILEIEIQEKEAQKILVYTSQMEALSDWFSWQLAKEEFFQKSTRTKKYVAVTAWCAKEDLKAIKDTIKEETSDYIVKEVPIKDVEKPPVILRNKGVFSSFGVVTGVYGLPKSDEIDPTPFLAPFFIFYFALALSDAGYGLMLAMIAFLGKKFFKKANADKFFNLFIACGLLTTVAGVLIGTIFGGNYLPSLRVADPLTDPVGALLFVLALGVLQIFAGLVIGMVWLMKQGKVKEAVSGNGASIAFFIGAILFLITRNINFMISGAASMAILAFIYADANGLGARIGKALGSFYGLISFVGDILSYSRILALGLATGIIASVINMIAVIFMEMIPVPGLNLLIAGVVLVVGHIGNLLINALGAFIHSARLQFVEFFSRFMEGGGRYFKPLSKKGRFVEVIN